MDGEHRPERMRLGVTVPFEGLTMDQSPGLLARAERIGYEEAWSYERNVFDAFTPLAASAVVTERMRLGAAIVPAFTRPPGLIAMSAAGVAELAPGRFVLGLGASTRTIVTDWMGLEFGRPLARVEQTARAVRTLLAGERLGALRLHRPPAAPVPLYVGALGERMLRLTGEIADGVALFLARPAFVPQILDLVGRRLDSVARVAVVTGGDLAARMTFARRFIAGYLTVPAYVRFLAAQGFEAEVGAVVSAWRSGDRRGAADAVSEAMVSQLVLIDHDRDLERRLAEYAASGVGCLDLWFMSTAKEEPQVRRDIEDVLERFAQLGAEARLTAAARRQADRAPAPVAE